ncbi:MAG TPA: hypothetical protein VLE44_00020 [Candidatus Saccharimonadales bacterium]|nr:hypothetical protein [Candidatus Saccharimonadales bacterium]
MSVENLPEQNKKPLHETLGITPEQFRTLQNNLLKTMEEVFSDPDLIEKSEEFHKKATRISPENLVRPFDV